MAYVRKLASMLSVFKEHDSNEGDPKIDVPLPFVNRDGELIVEVVVKEAVIVPLDVLYNEEDKRSDDADPKEDSDQPVVMCVMRAHREQHQADQTPNEGNRDNFEGVVESKLVCLPRTEVHVTPRKKSGEAHHEEVAKYCDR